MSRGAWAAASAAALAAAALAAFACGAPAPPPAPPVEKPLETVEVSAAPDATATTATDVVERRAAEPAGFSGVLPEGFPAAVPILRPSSLVEVEPVADGGLAVTLASRAAPAEIDRAYRALLAAAGWEKGDGSPGAVGRWRRENLSLDVAIADTRPGGRLRLAVGHGGG